eukprot:1402399-Amphidinium_carterae.1
MAWMINGYIDLGLASFPTECVAGTRMDFTGTELCVACSPGSISLGVDAEECQSCVQGPFPQKGRLKRNPQTKRPDLKILQNAIAA